MTAQVLFFDVFSDKDLHLNAVENMKINPIWSIAWYLCYIVVISTILVLI